MMSEVRVVLGAAANFEDGKGWNWDLHKDLGDSAPFPVLHTLTLTHGGQVL